MLAKSYVDQAIDAIRDFPESEAKNGLIEMCNKVMKRRK
jgi:hexaprenyl-diphosphate synthase